MDSEADGVLALGELEEAAGELLTGLATLVDEYPAGEVEAGELVVAGALLDGLLGVATEELVV